MTKRPMRPPNAYEFPRLRQVTVALVSQFVTIDEALRIMMIIPSPIG